MIERLTRTLVTFLHPFQLDESGEVFPAGAYATETEESWADGDSFHAARRVSTVLVVRPQPQELGRRNRYLSINWASLAAAIERDKIRDAEERTAWNRELTAASNGNTCQVVRLARPGAEQISHLRHVH